MVNNHVCFMTCACACVLLYRAEDPVDVDILAVTCRPRFDLKCFMCPLLDKRLAAAKDINLLCKMAMSGVDNKTGRFSYQQCNT